MTSERKEYCGRFKVGDRIRMEFCADPISPIPSGTEGTIDHIDDAGALHMKWDDGRTLGVCLEEDCVRYIGHRA